jgi:hypothetical protein
MDFRQIFSVVDNQIWVRNWWNIISFAVHCHFHWIGSRLVTKNQIVKTDFVVVSLRKREAARLSSSLFRIETTTKSFD